MKSFLDLHVRVDLFHEAINHSPLPWAGVSYTLSMSPLNWLRSMMRRHWLPELESASLNAVVGCYRRGILKPTTIRLVLPYDGKARIHSIASHAPQLAPFWRRIHRLTPSGKRHESAPSQSPAQAGPQHRKIHANLAYDNVHHAQAGAQT